MASIIIEHVTKLYASGMPALSDVNLEVADGEQVVVVGPSGCGKSTLLRLIAGLEDLTSGRILIGGRDITHVAPKDRDVAMVFQDYALYPHMTVRQNMSYSLRLRRMPRPEIDARVVKAAEMLGLTPYLDRRPATLSGGQKQRVALGRAIIREPKAFLMDEPLSNLDAKLRSETRAELGRLHDRLRTTTLYVTHDQAEAMTLADRIVVLKSGSIQQVAPPDVTYHAPNNMFVAGFIGSPAMNLFRARLESLDGQYMLLWRGQRLMIDPSRAIGSDRLKSHVAGEVIVGVRPEHFMALHKADNAVGTGAVPGIIRAVENMGSERLIFVEPFADARDEGNSVGPVVGEEGMSGTDVMIARDFGASRIQRGDAVALVPDPTRIHLFSAQTEQTIL